MIFSISHKIYLVVFLWMVLFLSYSTEIYTYYFQPIIHENNIRARVYILVKPKGVRDNLTMDLDVSGAYSTSFDVQDLDEIYRKPYRNYIDKEINVVFEYKINPCQWCLFARHIIPYQIYNRDMIFLSVENSRKIINDNFCRAIVYIFFIITIMSFTIYFSAIYPNIK